MLAVMSRVPKTGAIATNEIRDIASLSLWDKNPRSIKTERFTELKNRLIRQGQIKPLLITRQGTVIGGNMRLRAMQELGITEVWVTITEAQTDKEIFDLALTDNEEFGYYEKEQLAELALALELTPLELQSYELNLGKTTTLDLVLDEFQPTPEEDEVPEVDDVNEPESVLGEVYQLGSHRLMCGSATEQADVALLMDGAKADMVFTDPPYGMFLDADFSSIKGTMGSIGATHGTKGKKYDNVIGDHDDFTPELITTIFDNFSYCDEMFLFGADYYAELIPNKNNGSWCVWDKRKVSQEDAIGAEFELLWSKQKHKRRMLRHDWFGFLSSENTADARNRVHPTQKPLTLLVDVMKQWGKSGDCVIDIYGGSGSTLIACEQTNRICRMMELDPRYVDVIRKRYAKHIGEEESWQEVTPSVNVLALV